VPKNCPQSDPNPSSSNYLTSKKILSADSPTLKLLAIPLLHSPYPPSSTVLVITKDSHDPFAQKRAGNLRRQQCLGMGAIRKSYNSYQQPRRLRDGEIVGDEPALILADEKLISRLFGPGPEPAEASRNELVNNESY
jgi:hypothetical protein